MPDSSYEKLGAEQLGTKEGRRRAITQLVTWHSGEVVELDPHRTQWFLRRKAPGPASVDWQNEQWHCCEKGEPVGDRVDGEGWYEYGMPGARDLASIESQVHVHQRWWHSNGRWLEKKDLLPDWRAWCIRCRVPCQNADTHEWLRKGLVTTLGARRILQRPGHRPHGEGHLRLLSHVPPDCAQEEEGPLHADGAARLCQRLLRVKQHRRDRE